MTTRIQGADDPTVGGSPWWWLLPYALLIGGCAVAAYVVSGLLTGYDQWWSLVVRLAAPLTIILVAAWAADPLWQFTQPAPLRAAAAAVAEAARSQPAGVGLVDDDSGHELLVQRRFRVWIVYRASVDAISQAKSDVRAGEPLSTFPVRAFLSDHRSAGAYDEVVVVRHAPDHDQGVEFVKLPKVPWWQSWIGAGLDLRHGAPTAPEVLEVAAQLRRAKPVEPEPPAVHART